MIRGFGVVDGPDVDFVRQAFDHLLLQLLVIGKTLEQSWSPVKIWSLFKCFRWNLHLQIGTFVVKYLVMKFITIKRNNVWRTQKMDWSYLVSNVDVILESEWKFPPSKKGFVDVTGSQPPAVGLVGEQPLVVDGQQVVERFRIVGWAHFERVLRDNLKNSGLGWKKNCYWFVKGLFIWRHFTLLPSQSFSVISLPNFFHFEINVSHYKTQLLNTKFRHNRGLREY